MRFLKKCIKKLYHLIWFLCLFVIFFSPVKAETLDFNSSDIRSFTYCRLDGTCVFDTQLNVTSLSNSNHLYYGTDQLNESHRLYQININRSHFDGVNDGDNVSFYMYDNRSRFMLCGLYAPDSNYIQQNSNSFLPLVTLNNYYCDVHIYGLDGSTENNCSFERRFYVSCPYYHNTTYDFDYIQSYYNNGNTSAGASGFFGITTMYITRSTEQTIQDIQEGVDKVDDSINNNNVDGANSQVDDLLNDSNFSDSTGIQSIINAPLNFINSLSNTCTPINLTIPYIDEPVQIPCIKQELNNHIPLIVPVLSTAINGFIIYRILLDIVRIIKNARNPDDDRIEVLDL